MKLLEKETLFTWGGFKKRNMDTNENSYREALRMMMSRKKKYPKPLRGKYVYCSECWGKLDNDICFCVSYTKERPYFCGHCNCHVSAVSAKKLEPILKLMKKSKIELPEQIDTSEW